MKVKRIVVGPLEENCYILNIDNNYLIIDPGDEYIKILNEIKGNLLGILITHYHFDHIGALQDILDYKNVPIYDYKSINKEVNIEKFNFRIINFPGHKEDLVGFLFDNKLYLVEILFLKEQSEELTCLAVTIKKCKKVLKKYYRLKMIYKYIQDMANLQIYQMKEKI